MVYKNVTMKGRKTVHIPTTTLHNGVKMPMIGLGVYKAKEGDEVKQAVKTALEVGYRSIDTATVYENESGVGEAVRESESREKTCLLQQKFGTTIKGTRRRSRRLKKFKEITNGVCRFIFNPLADKREVC